ncbi:hypothetical protein KIW84_075072 [Lathyrus oleraceus]|uniref:Uncharacterized protein n=1 Tax=Pisum sativum TaxID=3888 RepID=A0A9D4VTX1_PEA|nr:hypothetical protein KIW84_075072 [Pisum sativum]
MHSNRGKAPDQDGRGVKEKGIVEGTSKLVEVSMDVAEYGNKAKDNKIVGTHLLAAKEKNISGVSKNMLWAVNKEVVNGNHDVIIKGNIKGNINKAIIIGGSAVSGSVVEVTTKKDDLAFSLDELRSNDGQGNKNNNSLRENIIDNNCCNDSVRRKRGKLDQNKTKRVNMLTTRGAEGFKGIISGINKKGIEGIIEIRGELEIRQSEQINIIRKEKEALTSQIRKSLNEAKVVKQNRMLASLQDGEKHDRNFFLIRPLDSKEVNVVVNKSGEGNDAGERSSLDADILSQGEDLTMIYEKLDRAMSNTVLIEMFPDAHVKVLARVEFSDHHPILIMPYMRMTNITTRPFKFESALLVDDSYHNMLRRSWRREVSMGENLEKEKEDIKSWKASSLDQRYYKNVFVVKHMWKEWKHIDISYPELNDTDIQNLREPLSNDKIKIAMFSMKPWKTPGLDAFPAGFYQKSWDI